MKGKVANSFTLHFQNDRSLSKVSRKIICRCLGQRQIIHFRDRKQSPWSVIASSIKPWVNGRKQGTIHMSSNYSSLFTVGILICALDLKKSIFQVSRFFSLTKSLRLQMPLSFLEFLLLYAQENELNCSPMTPETFCHCDSKEEEAAQEWNIIVHGPDRIFLPVLGTNCD